jgi:hypothetical protein
LDLKERAGMWSRALVFHSQGFNEATQASLRYTGLRFSNAGDLSEVRAPKTTLINDWLSPNTQFSTQSA